MAGTPASRQLQPLAPKPASTPGPSPPPAHPNTTPQLPIFNDCAAVTPVTMGDEPFRRLTERRDSPASHMTTEQLIDTRLCVSSLTPQQCRQMMCQLDDHQIKNAVYDRALCFPFDQWTENIRLSYGRQVQHDNKVLTSFANMTDHMDAMFAVWREVYFFKEGDYQNIAEHVQGYVAPSIDNIGVYGTFSELVGTKINALAALLKVGTIIVGMPIMTTQRGVALFAYDPLSRAVGNILSSATTDASRRQILSLKLETDFLELCKSCRVSGIFPGLLKAVTSGSGDALYNVPRGDQLEPGRNKRSSADQISPAVKRTRTAQGGQHKDQAALDRQGDSSSRPPRASSHQPRAQVAESDGPRNPFSRPASAGPISLPFTKSVYAPPSKAQPESGRVGQEPIDPGLRDSNSGAELQGIVKSATEYQNGSQDAPQATEGADGQLEQATGEDDGESANTGTEAESPSAENQLQQQQQQQQQPQKTDQAATSEYERPDYDELLRRIEMEVFHVTVKETPEQQLARAPSVVALIDGTAGIILKLFQNAAMECRERGRHDIFLSSLKDTGFALVWIIESCALNIAGTPLSAEVSAKISRDSLVGALWGSVRLASAAECMSLLDAKDNVCPETFNEKLERIARQLDENKIAGFDSLRFILASMRSENLVPFQDSSSQPGPSDK